MAGCLVSLSMLSTRLTLLLMVATPALMGVGTLMGSALRKLSRQCQEQVSEFPPSPPVLPSFSAPCAPRSPSPSASWLSNFWVPCRSPGQRVWQMRPWAMFGPCEPSPWSSGRRSES